MNCSDVRPLLNLLSDDALETKDVAIVLEHLSSCVECDSELMEIDGLHRKFKLERDKVVPPPDLTEKINISLRQERRSRVRLMPSYSIGATAAISILLTAAALMALQHRTGETTISADSMVEDMAVSSSISPVASTAELPARLGYSPKYLKLRSWQLQQCGVYVADRSRPIAKFDFARGSERMSCYQGPEGSIKTTHAQTKLIGDKRVALGSHGKYNFAMWSQNGRDYLIVTPSTGAKLEEIVRNA